MFNNVITIIASRILMVWALFFSFSAQALTLEMPSDGSNIVGMMQTTEIEEGETLADVGRRMDMGLLELIEANPQIHPWRPKPGTQVIIPSRFILPPGPREGIVINLPELRMYYYSPTSKLVSTFPIAIGKLGWGTPVATTQVVDKKEDPYWTVPDSILAEKIASGIYDFPKVIPPGPKNPLGKYALRLGLNGYLIHGTNLKGGIGSRVSHGCMRMQPADIDALFHMVNIGTPVRIIHEPYKIGFEKGEIYLEAHKPLAEEAAFTPDAIFTVHHLLSQIMQPDIKIEWNIVQQISEKTNGWPVVIGRYNTYNMDYSLIGGVPEINPAPKKPSPSAPTTFQSEPKAKPPRPLNSMQTIFRRNFVIDSSEL
jgi:L,D-transpeptidase ErfK/SrfK